MKLDIELQSPIKEGKKTLRIWRGARRRFEVLLALIEGARGQVVPRAARPLDWASAGKVRLAGSSGDAAPGALATALSVRGSLYPTRGA